MFLFQLADSADGSNDDMDYHIEIINKDDKLRVLKFLRRFFFRDEPLNQSIQLIPEGEDSTCMELEDYCSHTSLENNLSLMAVSANGTIVGVQLNGKVVTSGFSSIQKNFFCRADIFSSNHRKHSSITIDVTLAVDFISRASSRSIVSLYLPSNSHQAHILRKEF